MEADLTIEKLKEEGIRTSRPTCRQECPVVRPCPFVGCRYHLYLDITDGGNIKYNFYGIEPWDMQFSCALDLADSGELGLTQIGHVMGLTRERVRQIEKDALAKLGAYVSQDGLWDWADEEEDLDLLSMLEEENETV